MNNLTILLFKLFETILKNACIISNNTVYTYEYILSSSINMAVYLNSLSLNKINIALIANNSIEWIITFLAIIISKHHLVLISPKCSLSKIYHALQAYNVKILITDIPNLNLDKVTTVRSIYIISEIKFDSSSITIYKIHDISSAKDDNGISVVTPREIKSVFISYDEIIDTLNILEEKKIFEKCESYVCNQEFTYNYILCLLFPILQETTIILGSYNKSLTIDKSDTVILTGYQFESLWREYVEDKTDVFTEFLIDFKFKRLRRWRIKNHLRKLFPNITNLIILNSSISYEIEQILKKIKFPYTITYGTIETGGITTYTDPKKFNLGTVGKPLSNNLRISNTNIVYHKLVDFEKELYADCQLDDIGNFQKHDLVLECRKEEILKSSYGFIISRIAEKILKSLPLVIDCILTI